jgi:inner membrane protein
MALGNKTQKAATAQGGRLFSVVLPQLRPAPRLAVIHVRRSLRSMMELLEAVRRALRSPAFKFFLVVFLILLLTVPLLLVYALIWERESRAQAVRREVGQLWGPEQQILGPFLVVPYTVRIHTVQGDKRIEQLQERRAVFAPEALEAVGRAEAKTLRRSIFEVPVYAARLTLSGRFAAPRMADVAAEVASVRWRDAAFVLGLSGVSGLKEAAVLKIAGAADVPFSPSLGIPSTHMQGVHAKLAGAAGLVQPDPEQPPQAFAFTVDLVFNGSVSLNVAPVARETRVSLASDWPHPSFVGAFLPDDRQVTASGFTASWKVPHLARSVPEAWTLSDGGLQRLQPFAFGVRMISPVDFYSLVTRAVKYGIQFLALAFMAVFCLELVSARRVHPVQYLFTGAALVFFYVLLLSLAEHLGFTTAYLAASVATGAMLAIYVGAALASVFKGLVMLAVFAATYTILYLILQLEDYALLAGAILGFVALTIVMFVTLRVDWSGAGARPVPQRA